MAATGGMASGQSGAAEDEYQPLHVNVGQRVLTNFSHFSMTIITKDGLR